MPEVARKIVGALLWSADGKLLLGKRSQEKGDFVGYWQAPGGGIESGETEIGALRRELFEEVGLNLTDDEKILRIDESGGITMFEVKLSKPTSAYLLSISSEFSEVNWFDSVELHSLKLVPAGIKLLEKMGVIGR